MTAGLHLQQMGRALRPGWRIIHAARARKLRRRGEEVKFSHFNGDRAVYAWKPKLSLAQVIDHVGSRGYAWNPRTQDWDDVPPTTNQGPK